LVQEEKAKKVDARSIQEITSLLDKLMKQREQKQEREKEAEKNN